MAEPIEIGGVTVPPGERAEVQLSLARLFTGTELTVPMSVLNGRQEGPRLWLNATLHGDELNGMEIIRRVLAKLDPRRLAGMVVAVPVVNVFGFIQLDRYLPDRRDLNRCFPGSSRGSLASRLAHLFVREVVRHCQYGLDFHTGSLHRENLPQIRAWLEDPETERLAQAFDAPLVYQPPSIGGTLRAAARKLGVKLLVFEGGEPLRFNEEAIRIGVRGTLRVMATLGMWKVDEEGAPSESFRAEKTRWIRASRSGIFRLEVGLGEEIEEGATLGRIYADALTHRFRRVRSPSAGLVMGFTQIPVVHQGDALVHLAMQG